MEQTEKEKFDALYQQHLRLLKLQGMAQKSIDPYYKNTSNKVLQEPTPRERF